MSTAITEETTVQGAGAEDLFRTMRALGVVLVVDGERLRVRAPRGVLTPPLRAAMDHEREALRSLMVSQFREPRTCLVARGDVGLVQPCRRMSPCARPVDGRPCLVPATCCVCGEVLSVGRRYCCPACGDSIPFSSVQITDKGEIKL